MYIYLERVCNLNANVPASQEAGDMTSCDIRVTCHPGWLRIPYTTCGSMLILFDEVFTLPLSKRFELHSTS